AADWWQTVIALGRPGDRADTALEMRLGRSLLLAGRTGEGRGPFVAAAALAVGDTVAEVAADYRLVALLDRALRHPRVPPGQLARLTARWAIATYWQQGGREESRGASLRAVRLGEAADDT